jgi:hypothetical protein
MNKRIKELAEQAGYYLYDLTETHGMKTVETDSMDEWITFEKFAELIVRECVNVVDDMADPEDSERYFWVIQNVSQKIKQHFGVEE